MRGDELSSGDAVTSSGMVAGARGVGCGDGGSTAGSNSAIGVDSQGQWTWGLWCFNAEGSSGLSGWGIVGVETNLRMKKGGSMFSTLPLTRRTTSDKRTLSSVRGRTKGLYRGGPPCACGSANADGLEGKASWE